MKTLSGVITEADGLRPGNPFTNDQKTAFINELEGRIQTEVFLSDTVEITTYGYTADSAKQLILPAPYDDLYLYHLLAMIDFSLGEYSKYQNSMAMFNEKYGGFVRYFASTYEPAQAGTEYMFLGEVGYTEDSAVPVELFTLQRGALILNAVCEIETPFDSGTSDVLILGTSADDDALMAAGDIDEEVEGIYTKAVYLTGGTGGTKIYATLTKTGTDATAGLAKFYGRVLQARR
jgi:hypothetical protein